MWNRKLSVVLVFLFLAGCASPRLPGYARPSSRSLSGAAVDALFERDLIRYRTLTVDDFKSSEPPERLLAYRDALRAATCCVLAPDGEAMVRVTRTSPNVFEARPPRDLKFVAYMDRDCSWLNPDQKRVPREYVLQHEQIHFAIYEIESRRLTAALRALAGDLVGRGATLAEAGASIDEQLDQYLSTHSARALARGTEFDEDTSMGVRPESQEKWHQAVQRELAETSR